VKNCLIASVIFAGGMLLGTILHPLTVRAQATGNANVFVDEMIGAGTSGTPIRGSQIAGFSCAVDGTGAIHCYAASVNRR
jgi:hypothetical protein